MDVLPTNYRETKYCHAIRAALQTRGHATNAQLLHDLRAHFPGLSATTVHRATARLAEKGDIGYAPSTNDGAIRYDTTAAAHSHFVCASCDTVHDITALEHDIVQRLQAHLNTGCIITGPFIVQGFCIGCKKKGNE